MRLNASNIVTYLLYLFMLKSVFSELEPKTSLVFVIDKTKSMAPVIKQVYNKSISILKTVVESTETPIENFVLVFFGDPNVYNAIVTTDIDEFSNALDLKEDDLESGEDCPEKSMSGIEIAINASLYGALVYVFTDASAKDYEKYGAVKKLAQEKNCQIQFILANSICSRDHEKPERSEVYYELAENTSGQVFHFQADITKWFMNYVRDSMTARKALLHSETYPPGNHTIEVELDSEPANLTLTVSKTTDASFSATMWGPDDTEYDDLYELVKSELVTVLKLDDIEAGKYKVEFKTKIASRLEITSTTDVTFRHGFSTKIVSSLNDTSVNPLPAGKNYLYIKLYGENVKLNTVTLLNTESKKKEPMEMTLKMQDVKQNLYVTDEFELPDVPFRIKVKGLNTETGMNIVRYGYMVLEKESFVKKIPKVSIKGESKLILESNVIFKLECEVDAYPEPRVIWKDLSDGKEIAEIVHHHPPYESKSTFSETANKNTTYACRAENKLGSDEKTVEVYVNPKPYINIHSLRDQIVDYGKKAVLQCKVDSYPPSKITWFPPKKLLRYRLNTKIFTINSSTMTINYLRPWGVGVYSCKIEYEKQIFWRKVHVTLNANPLWIYWDKTFPLDPLIAAMDLVGMFFPSRSIMDLRNGSSGNDPVKSGRPIIKKNPWLSEMVVFEGETTNLECSLTQGYPKPDIQWFFKSHFYPTAKYQELIERRNLTSISLKHLKIADTGFYYCKAKNALGKDERHFTVTVESKPSITEDTDLTKTAELDREVLLNCVVQGIPAPEVTWFKYDTEVKDNKPLHIDDYRINVFRDHSLRLSKLTEEDSGSYKCKAINKHGSAEKTIKLMVHYIHIEPPDDSSITKRRNQKLKLACDAEGFPEPIIYKWLFYSSDKTITVKTIDLRDPERGELVIKKVKEDQRGYYTCIASNGISSLNITYKVDVLFPPKILEQEPERTTVDGDMLLQISCKSTGNPRPKIVWWTDGHPYKGDSFMLAKGPGIHFDYSDDWLTFFNVTRKEQGDYHCEARNDIKTVEGSDIHITVHSSPPPDQIKENTNMILKKGTRAKLKCHLPYDKVVWLVWYKDGKVHHFGELTFDKVTKSNEGVYTCRVTKLDAPDKIQTANTTVIIGSKPTFIVDENENKEANLNEFVSLNCEADGDPVPTASWTHNGINLAYPSMVFSFNMRSDWIGTFVCKVSNAHGSITRTFDMAYKDCILKLNSSSNKRPLMITTTSKWPTFETKDGYTVIPKNEVLRFICPKQFTTIDATDVEATCIGGDAFAIDKNTYKYSDVNCLEEIKPKLRNLRIPCLGENTKAQKVVFVIDHKAIDAIDYCVDKIGNVIYAKHTIQSPADFIPKDTDMWDKTNLDYYQCDTQIKRNVVKKIEKEKCCYGRRYLVNARDLFPGPMQRAVFNKLNVVPQWSTCNAENWDEIESRVRKLSKSTKNDLVIYTGIAGYNTDEKRILRINGNQLIPMILWKVVQNPVTRNSIAIIQLNIPGVKFRKAKKLVICPDILCSEISWLKGPHWQAVKKGFTYCCSLEQFIKAFKLRFDRDFVAAAVFGPYYDILR